jgi:hypothetical protein
MANKIYRPWAAGVMAGTSGYDLDNDTVDDGVYVALVDTGTYTFSIDHDFYNDLAGVGATARITAPTVTNGVLDGGDVTFSAVAGTVTYEALVIYRHNAGANTTWPVVAFIDTGVTGLPVTSNGGDITVTWNASGIFALVAQS